MKKVDDFQNKGQGKIQKRSRAFEVAKMIFGGIASICLAVIVAIPRALKLFSKK